MKTAAKLLDAFACILFGHDWGFQYTPDMEHASRVCLQCKKRGA